MSPRYAPARNLVTRRIAGRTVLVPVAHGVADMESVYTLNEVGTRIWEMVPETADPAAIAERLAEEFQVSPAEAARDTREFLSELEAAGLILREEG